MTKRISFSLDLNENDLDALQTILKNPRKCAAAVAPCDVREQARIIDVLAEIAGAVAVAMGQSMAESLDTQLQQPSKGRSM
ncbi:MAG: hypothetical protein HY309_19125 [Pseudomonas fluorescens]|nr:hypothetical protein [Pseudomonas fluorescens]